RAVPPGRGPARPGRRPGDVDHRRPTLSERGHPGVGRGFLRVPQAPAPRPQSTRSTVPTWAALGLTEPNIDAVSPGRTASRLVATAFGTANSRMPASPCRRPKPLDR